MLTYGDGVSDVDIKALIEHHKKQGRLMTMTAVQPDGRFGTFEANPEGLVTQFLEKPRGDGSWINGGFFVCEPKVLDYIRHGDETILEREPLEALAHEGQLCAFNHSGFWKCMDTLRDKTDLNQMWDAGAAKWKTW
jgi:glucose-1-phosphate cytidylyltransferase